METKQLVITPPPGYEVDSENSTYDCIKFKPVKKRECYDDIADKLFEKKTTYYADAYGNTQSWIPYGPNRRLKNNCTSEEQLDKLLAINMLLNVAKHLNAPYFNSLEGQRYYIAYNPQTSKLRIDSTWNSCMAPCFFATVDAAKKAIKILGEDVVKLALNPEY